MRTTIVTAAVLVGALLAPAPGVRASSSATAQVSTAAGSAASSPALPWIEDDLTRAVAEAKARKVPLFVESWAPW